MSKFILMLVFVLATCFEVNAQTITNDVRLSAGVSNVNNRTLFTGGAEVRKAFNDKFGLVDTLSTVTDSDFTLVQNQAVVRFSPIEHVFVAGGVNVGKVQGSDPFVSPVIQGGANFDLGRINIEPFVQLETPDLASDNPARTLSGNLTAKLRITDTFGLVGTGALRATRADNDFFHGNAERVVTGGIYFNF